MHTLNEKCLLAVWSFKYFNYSYIICCFYSGNCPSRFHQLLVSTDDIIAIRTAIWRENCSPVLTYFLYKEITFK